MADNYTTTKYTLVFKGEPTHLTDSVLVRKTSNLGIYEATWLESSEEGCNEVESLSYINPDHEILSRIEAVITTGDDEADGTDEWDLRDSAQDLVSEVSNVLDQAQHFGCIAVVMETMYTCSRPCPGEYGVHIQAAKLVNGKVKAAGFSGYNILDAIGE